MNFNTKKVNIYDLCNVERAVAGKEYKAGSCYIKLSAVDESVGQIKNKGKIDSRYAVFEPRIESTLIICSLLLKDAFRSF